MRKEALVLAAFLTVPGIAMACSKNQQNFSNVEPTPISTPTLVDTPTPVLIVEPTSTPEESNSSLYKDSTLIKLLERFQCKTPDELEQCIQELTALVTPIHAAVQSALPSDKDIYFRTIRQNNPNDLMLTNEYTIQLIVGYREPSNNPENCPLNDLALLLPEDIIPLSHPNSQGVAEALQPLQSNIAGFFEHSFKTLAHIEIEQLVAQPSYVDGVPYIAQGFQIPSFKDLVVPLEGSIACDQSN